MKTPVFLRIYRNGKLESVKQFTVQQIVIGRSSEGQISLDDEAVSPVHAVIEERDSGYYISDLGSQTGTYKNGEKTFDEVLQSGDEIVVGPYRIEFFIGVPKPTQAPQTTVQPTVVPPPPTVTPTAARLGDEIKAPPPPPSKDKKRPEIPVTPMSPSSSVQTATPAVETKLEKTKISGADKELAQALRKSKGGTVEVVVAWRDRVLSTHHFTGKRDVTIGIAETNTIVLPLLGLTVPELTLLRIDGTVKVHITHEMTGDLYKDDQDISLSDLKRKNRLTQTANGFAFDLHQGEMIRLGLHGDLISIYVRFVPDSPAPILGPLFDLSASESTALLMSLVITAIFALYMAIYSPKPLEEPLVEEPPRKATITFNVPKKQVQVVEVAEEVPQQKKIVKVEEKTERTTTKPDPGTVSALKPSAQNKKTSIVSSTVKQGGTINTGKAAANAKSETRDVSKMGLMSAFGGKGTQKELSKAYDGSGELLGDAAKATGSSGSNEDRVGESLGGRLKNVGAGGKGSSTFGIAGVGTQGKGTGTFGGGTGGIGKKGRVDLNIGESEAEFSGSIDREAIRRVIRENKKLFENCYNMALRRNSDAYGKVEVKWYIQEKGRATNTVVKSNSVGDKEMGECLARVIRGLTFPEPPPDQIAEVTYPFVFAAQ